MGKNLLIVQNFNPNKGNNSVVTAMMHVLRDKNVSIEITSAIPEQATLQYGVPCFDWLVSYKNVLYCKSKIKKLFALICEMIWVLYLLIWIIFYKINVVLWIPSRKKKTMEAYMRADVVVFPGGHSFTTMNGFGQVFSHCVGFYFGKIIGKKTMVYAHTIGPFNGILSIIIKKMSLYVLKRTDVVTVRESDSLKYCTDCNVILTAETVFSLPSNIHLGESIKELQIVRHKGRIVVGLTIHHIYYKYFYSKKEYIEKMVGCIDLMVDKYGCSVLLIPMEANEGTYNDRDLAREIKQSVKYQDDFIIIENDYEPDVTCSIIANCDLFVGTKTHSIVYGLKSEVPTLSISYQQKANEFMKMYGVLENAIDLKNLSVENFEVIFSKMISNMDSIREIQKEHNSLVIKESLKNRDILLDLLSND